METPHYVFDTGKIRSNWQNLKSAIKPDRMFYALKANGDAEILRTLCQVGANFEIGSPGELDSLARLGVPAEKIICSLPVKKKEFISTLHEYGIRYFVFDTVDEFTKIARLAPDSKKIFRLDITGTAAHTIPFGAMPDMLHEWIVNGMISPSDIDGITFYISKNKDITTFISVLKLCESIIKDLRISPILNIGGNYRLPEELDSGFYYRARIELDHIRDEYGAKIFAEPGRSIVKNAGMLLSTVVSVKQRGDSEWIYIDAGVPTGISYVPDTISLIGKSEACCQHKYVFFDITCSHRPLFEKYLDYKLQPGDIISMNNFGSYSLAKASTFHGWKLPFVSYI